MAPRRLEYGLVQVGHGYVGLGLVSMSPDSRSSRGRNAGDRSLPLNKKVCGCWCSGVGIDRKTADARSATPRRAGKPARRGREVVGDFRRGQGPARLHLVKAPSWKAPSQPAIELRCVSAPSELLRFRARNRDFGKFCVTRVTRDGVAHAYLIESTQLRQSEL